MKISGIQKTSLIDYPKKICTVIFTRGCNFFCGFCHNPELVDPKKYTEIIKENQIINFLKKRKKIINAVTITGGEPTIHKKLPDFIKKVKKLNFLVKLDTNGTNPKIINFLIKNNLIDYIAMDIKNSLNFYKRTVNQNVDIKNIKKTIDIIKKNKIPYEFRTTVVPKIHNTKSIKEIGILLKNTNLFYIQNFRKGKIIDSRLNNLTLFSSKQLLEFKTILKKYIKNVYIR